MRLFISASLCLLIAGGVRSSTVDTQEHDSISVESRGKGLVSLLDGISDILNSTLSTLQTLIQTLEAGDPNQNDLVKMLGLNKNTLTPGAANITTKTAGNVTCPDMAVLFARGTAEPGNVGLLTGPPFFTALRNYINGSSTLAIQGVPYPASPAAFRSSASSPDTTALSTLINATQSLCPTTKLVLAGYSQGANVVRGALSAQPGTSVSSVVLFGDPQNGTAVAGVAGERLRVFCHTADSICGGGKTVSAAHLNYSGDAPAAAMFAMQKSRLGIMSNDAVMEGMGNVPMETNPNPGQGQGTEQQQIG